MSDRTGIEWTDSTWPVVQGCDPVSPGCERCYAIGTVHRLAWNSNPKISAPLKGLVEHHKDRLRWTGKIALREDRLDWPLKWKTGRMIFVPSHGDIFHKDVPDEFLDKIFAVMALCPQHTFQVLTKRPERMREYFLGAHRYRDVHPLEDRHEAINAAMDAIAPAHWCARELDDCGGLPLKNVWLGISAEDQERWDERKEHLRNTPAAVHFASFEPLLGPIVEPRPMSDFIQWAIVGGESGPQARPMHPDWARSLRDQCAAAGVPFFYKQTGEWSEVDGPRCRGITQDGGHPTDSWMTREGLLERRDRNSNFKYSVYANSIMRRVGKKAAGRLLDGVEHNGMPQTKELQRCA
jgi:protein gp37